MRYLLIAILSMSVSLSAHAKEGFSGFFRYRDTRHKLHGLAYGKR